MLFQRSGGDRSFIPGYYSRQRTEDGRVQDGRRGGLTNEERKKETEEGERDSERDIDDKDGTGGGSTAPRTGNRQTDVETATHRASDGTRNRRAGTRRGTAGTGEPHKHAQQHGSETADEEDDKDKPDQHQEEGDKR